MSKLCGCGSGEEPCCNDDCSCVKALAHFVCVIAFIGLAVFLGLTVVSLVKYISVGLRTNAFISRNIGRAVRLFTKMT